MLDEAAASVTADDAVRRLLLVRIDDAYRLAMFILRDPLAAEDAVQEAALLAWDRRKSLRDSRTADGWFTGAVTTAQPGRSKRGRHSPAEQPRRSWAIAIGSWPAVRPCSSRTTLGRPGSRGTSVCRGLSGVSTWLIRCTCRPS